MISKRATHWFKQSWVRMGRQRTGKDFPSGAVLEAVVLGVLTAGSMTSQWKGGGGCGVEEEIRLAHDGESATETPQYQARTIRNSVVFWEVWLGGGLEKQRTEQGSLSEGCLSQVQAEPSTCWAFFRAGWEPEDQGQVSSQDSQWGPWSQNGASPGPRILGVWLLLLSRPWELAIRRSALMFPMCLAVGKFYVYHLI